MINAFRMKYLVAGLVAFILIDVTATWWQYHRAIVLVDNQSGQDVSQVQISVRGGTYEVGQLSAGSSRSLRVMPSSESEVSLFFDTPEHKSVKWAGEYLNSFGGYRVFITIGPNWQISSKCHLSRGFILLPLASKLMRHNRER